MPTILPSIPISDIVSNAWCFSKICSNVLRKCSWFLPTNYEGLLQYMISPRNLILNSHLPLDKMAAISPTIFSDAFSWMKTFAFWLNFHWSLFLTNLRTWPMQATNTYKKKHWQVTKGPKRTKATKHMFHDSPSFLLWKSSSQYMAVNIVFIISYFVLPYRYLSNRFPVCSMENMSNQLGDSPSWSRVKSLWFWIPLRF